MEEELERSVSELSPALKTLSGQVGVNWMLNILCQSVVEKLSYKMVWIGLIEEGSFEVKPVAQGGFEHGYLSSIKVRWDDSPLGRGPGGTSIRTLRPVIQRVTDAAFAPWREEAMKRGYRSIIGLPLIVEGKAIGALLVYSENESSFDFVEVKILEVFAAQAAEAIVRSQLNPRLIPEGRVERVPVVEKLEKSECYLVPGETPEKTFKIFADQVSRGTKGLCITRENPNKVRQKYGLPEIPIFRLTDRPTPGEKAVENLLELGLLIGSFVNTDETRVILLDGLEYLVSVNGFNAVLQFMQTKRSQITASNSIMIVPVSLEAFGKEEQALLKREMKLLE